MLSVETILKCEQSQNMFQFFILFLFFYRKIHTTTKDLQLPGMHLKYSWEKKKRKIKQLNKHNI